jgi:hypothetical protein
MAFTDIWEIDPRDNMQRNESNLLPVFSTKIEDRSQARTLNTSPTFQVLQVPFSFLPSVN